MSEIEEAVKEWHHAKAAYEDAIDKHILSKGWGIHAPDSVIQADARASCPEARERLRVAGVQLDLAREKKDEQLTDAHLSGYSQFNSLYQLQGENLLASTQTLHAERAVWEARLAQVEAS